MLGGKGGSMVGSLTEEQVDDLLREEWVGRIGCQQAGRTYVVPVAYVFDGSAVYAHSAEGRKLAIMRENPEVCFEVDRIESLHSWRSVVARGWFEELSGADAVAALQLLLGRLDDGAADEGEWRRPSITLFRIVLDEKSGRFETP
jgi:nitroimidazol reductase NimA-like FMN-containing flavoprotein (pyridoxamine 5'-phosphate oxidase superfamily)